MTKETMKRFTACVSIVLILISMLLFAKLMACNTALRNLSQDIVINIPGGNTGNIEININTDNGVQQAREEITKDMIESIIGLVITTPVSAITIKFALTGKLIIKRNK